MDQDTSQRVIAQALLGDTNVLSAVTSLLKKHNGVTKVCFLKMVLGLKKMVCFRFPDRP